MANRTRREVLRLAGGGLVGVAGCLGSGDGSGTRTTTRSPTTSRRTSTGPTTRPGTTDTATPGNGADAIEWTYDLGGTVSRPPVFDGDRVYVAGENGAVAALAPDTGTAVWRTTVDGGVNGLGSADGSPLVDDGTVFVAAGTRSGPHGDDYRVVAIDAATGDRRWTFAPDADLKFLSVLGATGGVVFVGTNDDALRTSGERAYGLDIASGDVRVAVETGDVSGGTVSGDVGYVAGQKRLHAIGTDGTERWTYALSEYGQLGPATDGENAYWGVRDPGGTRLRALRGGRVRWTFDDWFVTSVAAPGDVGLLVGGERVAALAPDGTERWRYSPGGFVGDTVVADGTLYFAGREDLVGVDARDGTVGWRAAVEHDLTFPRATAGDVVAARAVYENDAGDRVEDVRGYGPDGTRLWTFDRGTAIGGIAADDRRVFVPTDEGVVYARRSR